MQHQKSEYLYNIIPCLPVQTCSYAPLLDPCPDTVEYMCLPMSFAMYGASRLQDQRVKLSGWKAHLLSCAMKLTKSPCWAAQ